MNKRQQKKENKKIALFCSYFRSANSYQELREAKKWCLQQKVLHERFVKKCEGCQYFEEDVCIRPVYEPCVREEHGCAEMKA